MAEKSKVFYDFKKQVEALKKFRGHGTELISVYITPGYPLSDISGKLRDEYGQAANIKSKSTQQNVQSALERILNYLKMFKKTPENGMAIFAGNISESEGKVDMQLFCLEPPVPLNTQFYRCESKFVMAPLEELIDNTDSYGLVVMDGKEATVAILQGTKLKVVKQLNSTAHQKVSKGGQCVKPDTLVCLEDGRICEIRHIHAGEKVAAANFERFTTQNAACAAVFTKRTEKAIKITTKNPVFKITATPEHRFFAVSEAGIAEKLASEIRTGDFLLFPRQLPSPSTYSDDIGDLGQFIEYRPEVQESGRNLLRQTRENLSLRQKDAGAAAGICQMSISDLETGEYKTVERLDALLASYGLNREAFHQNHVTQHPSLQLPGFLTPAFSQFLGYLAGDGNVDSNRIKLYDGDPANLEAYALLAKEAFKIGAVMKRRTKKYGFVNRKAAENPCLTSSCHELRIYNKTLATIIQRAFPEIMAPAQKREMPQRILYASPKNTAAFIRGFFDAEASASSGRVSLAVTSEKMVRQLQLALLRFGIVSSAADKKAKFTPQHSLSINDRDSLERFHTIIGFSSPKKAAALKRILAAKSPTNYTNTMPINGRQVRRLIHEAGLKTERFQSAAMFLNGKRCMSENVFRRQIVEKAKQAADSGKAFETLEKILNGQLRMARVASVKQLAVEPQEYYDLNIPDAENYVANGLVVHNSAARYSRLHTEAVEYYYTRVGEAMNAFLNVKNLKGVIVGGPGPAKDDFAKQKPYNYQLKVIGVVDTGYTDEFGLREVIEKSGDIMAQQESVLEKKILDRFMREVSTNGLAAYGFTDIQQKVQSRQIETLLVSQGLELKKFTAACGQCGKEKTVYGDKYTPTDCSCGGKYQLKSEEDVLTDLIAEAEKNGVVVEFVSQDTAEGAQFFATFKGLGAFLRYK